MNSIKNFFLFTILAGSSAGYSKVVAVAVNGPTRIFTETIDNAKKTNALSFETENFTWWAFPSMPLQNLSGDEMVQSAPGSSWFESVNFKRNSSETYGYMQRRLTFTIDGRAPETTYQLSATQFFDIQEATRLPKDYMTSLTVDIGCAKNKTSDSFHREWTPFFGKPGFKHSDQSITSQVVIKPEICSENQFIVDVYVSAADAVSMDELELGIAERTPL